MRRRGFVGGAFAGLGLTATYARPAKPKAGGIPTTVYGKTGVKVSIIAQGGARMDLHPIDPETHAALLRAYDRWDSVMMPVHAADHAYRSFEKDRAARGR